MGTSSADSDGRRLVMRSTTPTTAPPSNHDVAGMFNAMERSLEELFDGMLRETKSDGEGLETQIEAIDGHRNRIKALLAKLASALSRFDELAASSARDSLTRDLNALDAYLDRISEMGQADMLSLQRLMEQKSQLESMISNVMKSASESSQSSISNLKRS